MPKQIYEFVWEVRCGEYEFLSSEWKVFDSMEQARAYNRRY